MTEFIYVLRLAPSGWIKVGRTNNLAKRIGTHANNATFGGSTLDRVSSAACADSQHAEDVILATVATLPGARLVHGRETFAGVSFSVVSSIADDVVSRVQAGSAPPRAAILAEPIPDLLQAIFDYVSDLGNGDRVPSRALREKLAPDLNETQFGWQLRKWGCPTGRTSASPKGPLVKDIRAAVKRASMGGGAEILKSA